MNALLDIVLPLVFAAIALCVGTYVGKKHLRGRLSNGWVLVLANAVGLFTLGIAIFLLHLPGTYCFGLAVFLGSAGYGALE